MRQTSFTKLLQGRLRLNCLNGALIILTSLKLTCNVNANPFRVAFFTPRPIKAINCVNHGNDVNRDGGFLAARKRESNITRDIILQNDNKRITRAHETRQFSKFSLTALQEKKSSDESSSTAMNSSSINAKLYLPVALLVSLSLTTLAALNNFLPGPPIDATAPPPFFATLPYGVAYSGSFDPYFPSLILRDASSTIFSVAAATAFVKLCTYPVTIGVLQPRDSRKIVHTLSAPLFILVWPLFSNAFGARFFAAIVPILFALRLFIAGTGANTSDGGNDGSESELARAISRSGDAREALQGPFFYTLVLFLSTFFCWTDSPIGIVSIATMAVGDGLADLIGRRFGSNNKWPFNKSKSMAGSAAFAIGSLFGSLGLLSWLIGWGVMDPFGLSLLGLMGRLAVIAVICAAIELVPIVDDNWSVPISAALLASVFLN
mmetsp:Transcript_31730/g.67259  ORF Transcript_31730/g.67259 Transcript_31730/m.67259 type:complete len:434 (+) Transcript_31730:45-1346(+)